MAQWDSGRLKQVWYRVGLRDDGSPKLKRANFDILQWQQPNGTTTETFVIPLGFTRFTDADLNDSDAATTEVDFGQEFGFYDQRSYLIEQHQHDGADTVFGVNGFGYV